MTAGPSVASSDGPGVRRLRVDVRSRLTQLVWLAGTLVLAGAAVVAVRYLVRDALAPWTAGEQAPAGILLALGLVALGLAAIWSAWRVAGRSPRAAFALGLGVLVGTRLLAVALLDGDLSSDYASYWSRARLMVDGAGFWTSVPPGYPFLEAVAIVLGGRHAGVAELLNVIAAAVGGLAVYDLVRRRWGARVAAAALMTLAVTPSQILFTPILGTETVYTAAVAVIVWVTARASARATSGGLLLAAACGVILGLSQYVRPTSQFFLVAAIVGLGLAAGVTARGWLRSAAVATLAFVLAVAPIVAWNASVNARLSVSPSLFDKWTLYVGLNAASDGTYNLADRRRISEAAGVPVHPVGSPYSSERLAAERAFNDTAGRFLPQRLRDQGLGTLRMQPRKFARMWQNADYPNLFLFGEDDPQPDQGAAAVAGLTAQLGWCLALLVALVGLWRARRGPPIEVTIALLIVALTAAVHVLAEAQPRYHEYVVPLVGVLASLAVVRPSTLRARAPVDGAPAEPGRPSVPEPA